MPQVDHLVAGAVLQDFVVFRTYTHSRSMHAANLDATKKGMYGLYEYGASLGGHSGT